MLWLSHWVPETLFEEGDEVQVLFGMNVDGQIKECGAHVLYFEEAEEKFKYFNTLQYAWDSNIAEVLFFAGEHVLCPCPCINS